MTEDSHVISHIAEILSRPHLTGCSFAAHYFKESKVAVGEVRESADIDALFQGAADKGLVAVAVLPDVLTMRSLKDFVDELPEDRWRKIWDINKLSLYWKTSECKWSNCMGLGPTGLIPPMRRVPYFSLVLWPGKQTRNTEEIVDFRDIPVEPKIRKNNLPLTKRFVREIYPEYDGKWKSITWAFEEESFNTGTGL